MKIAYVSIQFPVASEAFAAVEVRALRRLGAEVSVLTYRGAAKGAEAMLAQRGLADLEVDHGGPAAGVRGLLQVALRPGDSLWLVGMILFCCWCRPVQLVKALALVPRSLALLQRVESLRPDVVHLFWGHYPSLLGLLVQRRLPHIVVSLFLGSYDLETSFPLSARLAQQADLVATHARANLPALAALGLPPERVQVTYRGIELPSSPPTPEKDRGLMVVAERLVTEKHTSDALRVFAALSRDVPAARLQVLGQGPQAEVLKGLARQLDITERVTLAGHVPHSEALEILARAEVALTMSRSPSERLPNIMKEAMLQRCLCLSTRTPGIEELIDDGENGLIVELGDVDTAAGRLKAVLLDHGATTEFGRRAQNKVVKEFNVDSLMAERLEQWVGLRRNARRGAAA